MSNFAQKTMVISFMTTKKYILAYFRRKSMDFSPKKYTSQIEVSRSTPARARSARPEGNPEGKANLDPHELVLEVLYSFLLRLFPLAPMVLPGACLWLVEFSRPALTGCDRSDSVFFRPLPPLRGGLKNSTNHRRAPICCLVLACDWLDFQTSPH